MRQLEADQLAEETQLHHNDQVPGSSTSNNNTNTSSGNGTTSAPSTPPSAPGVIEKPVGSQGQPGAKSMPTSRRASGYGGATFGMEKLSLSVMEPAGGQGRGGWTRDEEDVDAEGAQSGSTGCDTRLKLILSGSVKYLGMGDDDPFPGIPKKENKVSLSTTRNSRSEYILAPLGCICRARPCTSLSNTPSGFRAKTL
jgi:hypothetical protein